MRRLLLVLAAAALAAAPGARAWTWPADGAVLREFHFGDDPYAGGLHRGIDIGGEPGAPVRAASGGTVSFAGTVPHGGKTVTIQTPDGFSVTHVHLGSIQVMRGAVI